MRKSIRLTILIFSLIIAGLPACAGEPKAHFKSGQYEQLMLAVDPQGKLTGYYREEQGDGVVKTCAFYLTGQDIGDEIPVVTWNKSTFLGTLKAEKNGVTLKIAQGREHPGCGLVLVPEIEEGLALDRVADGEWFELRKITKSRVYFHSSPDAARALKTFIVTGDVVGVIAKKGNWLEIESLSKKPSAKGWIPANTTSPLIPPKNQVLRPITSSSGINR